VVDTFGSLSHTLDLPLISATATAMMDIYIHPEATTLIKTQNRNSRPMYRNSLSQTQNFFPSVSSSSLALLLSFLLSSFFLSLPHCIERYSYCPKDTVFL
jgi:hypothetical protein